MRPKGDIEQEQPVLAYSRDQAGRRPLLTWVAAIWGIVAWSTAVTWRVLLTRPATEAFLAAVVGAMAAGAALTAVAERTEWRPTARRGIVHRAVLKLATGLNVIAPIFAYFIWTAYRFAIR